MKYRKLLFVLMLVCFAASAMAQERYIEIVRKYGKPNMFIEEVKFPTSSPDSLRLLVNFRISYNYLVFVKDKNGKFSAEALFSVEVLKDDVGAGRQMVKRRVTVDDFAETEAKKKYVSASVQLDLATGKYELIAEVLDNQNRKSLKRKKKKIELTWENSPIRISDPLFLRRYRVNERQITIEPLAFSGKGLFGKRYPSAVEVFLSQKDSLSEMKYELFLMLGDENKLIKSAMINLPEIFPISSKHKEIAKLQDAKLMIDRKRQSAHRLAFIDFDASTLDNAKYKLVVTAKSKSGLSGRVEKEFENAWIDMPYPLYDIDLALRLMGYIVPPRVSNALESGNAMQRRINFKKYWKKKDPTPETAFNEVMAEYFRRVDYAFFNFYTNRDYGWRTDRGRIYILYGEPQKIERIFPINKPTRETWMYESPINKKFIFSDESNNGTYNLISESRFYQEKDAH